MDNQLTSCHSAIHNFITQKKNDSIKTYDTYLKHYNDFFGYMHDINVIVGNDLWSVTWDDILNVDSSHIKKFQKFIVNKKKLSNKTCNQKLFAVKKLWDSLAIDNKNIDKRILEFEELKEEDNSYAILTSKEVYQLIEFAKARPKGEIQAMIFEFLYIIGCRKNVALTVKAEQFERRYDYDQESEAWVVVYDEKGKKGIAKSMSDEFYEKCMSFKQEGKTKLFNVSHVLIEDTFDAFRKEYGLEVKNGKKVVIHSIKKASGWSVYKATGGDLIKTKDHMQHEHVNLTSKTYLDNKDNYCSQGSYLLSQDVSIDFLNDLSKEEIVKLIGKCGKDTRDRIWYVWENEKGI